LNELKKRIAVIKMMQNMKKNTIFALFMALWYQKQNKKATNPLIIYFKHLVISSFSFFIPDVFKSNKKPSKNRKNDPDFIQSIQHPRSLALHCLQKLLN
jgi:hypothetical protein